MAYTIKKLAEMAGVSVRTLHHYDAIGLVVPAARSASGYRLYGEPELLRLQAVLFYRELDLGLEAIGRILDEPGYEAIAALESQDRLLAARAERLSKLRNTIGRTISRLRGETMLSDEELYEGFAREDVERIKAEARERWGSTEAYAESQRRVGRMGKADLDRVKTEGAAIDAAAAAAMAAGQDPASAAVQAIMARKYKHLRAFYEPSKEIFAGLGRMYFEDERFRANYEKLAPGLADYLRKAMGAYAGED